MEIGDLVYRTEDIKDSEIKDYYVESKMDKENIEHLMRQTPVLLVGSRGTGKTMLLKMAEKKMDEQLAEKSILAVLVSFNKALLVDTNNDASYFRQWMLSKILFALRRKISKIGKTVNDTRIFNTYFNIKITKDVVEEKLDQYIELLENSWTNKCGNLSADIEKVFGKPIRSVQIINEMDYFKAFAEDICEAYGFERVVLLFDEACHNFIPVQQREFFTMFRDMRSPYISCKAAVYPGITSYGSTFQKFHDAMVVRIERDITDQDYVDLMREMVKNQTSKKTFEIFEKSGETFNALIYASSGNPRLLLKSVWIASKNLTSLKLNDVNDTIKNFYRNDIWNEHTKLGEVYKGHKALIDWGRNFIETKVLEDTKSKNISRLIKDGKNQTIYFAIHRDAPEVVKSAIRILEYSGIVTLITEGTKVRGDIFDRYQLNCGLILATEQNPLSRYKELISGLSVKIYTDYGVNSPSYENINNINTKNMDDMSQVLEGVLGKTIYDLDLTKFQKETIYNVGFSTLGDILKGNEEDLQRAFGIGPSRSRKIFNRAYNAAVEYISG